MILADHLRSSRRAAPQSEALIFGDQRWTYAEIDDLTDSLATNLASLGVRHGDRVALQLANCPELVFSYYACFKLGAIAVPVNNRFAPAEIEYTLNHSASRVCISQVDLFTNVATIRSRLTSVEHFFLIDGVSEGGARHFRELVQKPASLLEFPPVESTDVAAVLYTSGTTSRPKGVTHTNASLHATVAYHGRAIGLQGDDVICIVPPMCHILGFSSQMLGGIWAGGKLVLLERTDPESILSTIDRHRATRMAALPVLLQSLINFPHKDRYKMDSLRTCLAGGDAVPVTLQQKFFESFGVPVLEGCGMTEVIPFTLNLPDQRRVGSIGRVCPGMEIRLVDDSGNDVPPGATGEMLVRSDAAMVGYWNEPEITAATLEGGYVHTGDLGRIDEDQYYWFMGRKKEIIIRSGSNISPLEVEEVLYQHPAVRECGVVGIPDEQVGETVWAYVAPFFGKTLSVADLQEFARHRLAAYKVPERIEFLPELPKGVTGKVHRRTLREWGIRKSNGAIT